jgi:hypothetical protein
VHTPETLARAVEDALAANDLATIVAKVDAHYVPPPIAAGFVTDLSLLENRFEFARSLRRG